MTRPVIVVAASGLLLSCVETGPSGPVPSVLVFCDVSQSNDPAHFATPVSAIAKAVPRPGSLQILGIHSQTRDAQPVLTSVKKPGDSEMMEKDEDNRLHSAVRESLKEFVSLKGNHRKATCVLDTLQRASEARKAGSVSVFTLVYLSDMLEDCDRSQFPKSERGASAAEPALANRLGSDYRRSLVDITGARVVVCRSLAAVDPAARSTKTDEGPMGHWSQAERKEFWEEIFRKSGAATTSFVVSSDCEHAFRRSLDQAQVPTK